MTNGLLGGTGLPLLPACVIVVWTSRATDSAARPANVSFLIIFIGSVCLFLFFDYCERLGCRRNSNSVIRPSVVECFGCRSSQKRDSSLQIVKKRTEAVSNVPTLAVPAVLHLNLPPSDQGHLYEDLP